MASIFLRGRMFWILYYQDGEKITYSLKTRDKTVAKFKKNEIENKLTKGDNPIPDTSRTAQEIFKEYVEQSKHSKKHKTIRDDQTRVEMFFQWAEISRLKQINEINLKKYLDFRMESSNPINKNTANHIVTNIKTFLNFAVKRNYLAGNPLRSFPKFKMDSAPPKFLTKAEIKTILEVAKEEHLYPAIATAIYTGMRLGELKRLNWEDIDFARNEIIVRISKSGKFRVIPLHADLKQSLGPYRAKGPCFEWHNTRRIFWRIVRAAGHYRKIVIAPKKWRYTPTIGWHTFRHTFASQLVMNGVDLVTVGKLLGHASITTTMIYSHLSNDHLKESIKSLRF